MCTKKESPVKRKAAGSRVASRPPGTLFPAFTARRLVAQWQPDLFVMAGVGGALAPALAVADIVIGARVLTSAALRIPPILPAYDGSSPPAVHTGMLLSRDRVLTTPEQKREAARAALDDLERVAGGATSADPAALSPLCVEMETAGLARVAEEHGIPWAAVRAVSDTSEEGLPLDFNRLRGANGDLPVSRVALAAVTHPWSIPGLIRLGKNSSAAADALAIFLAGWIRRGCRVIDPDP